MLCLQGYSIYLLSLERRIKKGAQYSCMYLCRYQVKTKTQAQIQKQWVEHYALSYPIGIKSIFPYSLRNGKSQKLADSTQWFRKENHVKAANVLRTCRKENSWFANYFSAVVTNGACSTVSPSKVLALPVEIRIEKFGFARFRFLRSYGKTVTESQNNRK